MRLLLDSFWRAVAYCLHPRVIALSFLPLVLMGALSVGLGLAFWQQAIDAVRAWLEASQWLERLWSWLSLVGLGQLRAAAAPLLVIVVATPFIVLGSLLVVALLMVPAMVRLVAERRFATLERKRGGALWLGLLWSAGSTLLAIVALVVSLPLWLVPPLVLVLPPLIWGWLTYRVMSFDVLAEHASREERIELMRRHRGWLLGIGVLTGYLGSAPSLIWASGALVAAAFVLLVPLAIWIYTLVFAFSALWFTHYGLAALAALRAERARMPAASGPVVDALASGDEPPATFLSGPP